MEDTKLHAENNELHVKPPPDVTSRPYLPYFWNLKLPLNDPARHGKTSSAILQSSKVDGLDYGNRGLVPDYCRHTTFSVEMLILSTMKRIRLYPILRRSIWSFRSSKC